MESLYIVDDEALIRIGLTVLAEQYGQFNKIQSFENGHAALEAIKKAPSSLVMTDIRMPRMDGLTLCEEIHRMQLKLK